MKPFSASTAIKGSTPKDIPFFMMSPFSFASAFFLAALVVSFAGGATNVSLSGLTISIGEASWPSFVEKVFSFWADALKIKAVSAMAVRVIFFIVLMVV